MPKKLLRFIQRNFHIQILLLWAFLVLIGLTGRSYFPIDETRYVTVAWNMWMNGDYLVPYLNGTAYSHKPPMLFWLINLGWAILGVNDWWPRLIPSLFALASIGVTRKIADLLWPNQTQIKDNASLILLSFALWVAYSTMLMFDMLIAFFTVLGIWGLLIVLQTRALKGWLLFTLAIGGGLLAKGPTILLQLLPLAFTAPWWHKEQHLNAKNWYFPILYCVLGGAAIALLWAIPAGIRGGAVYQHAIFWGQTAERMVDSFAHNRPFWWYLPILPLLLFPWLLWGIFWRGLWRSLITEKTLLNDLGIRFCLAWLVPVFVAFSFISGKQVHYILPLFPAFALLIARLSLPQSTDMRLTNSRKFLLPISLATIALGVFLMILPSYIQSHPKAGAWLQQIPLSLGGFVILLGVLIFALPKKSANNTVMQLTLLSISLVTTLLFVLMHTAGYAYDVRPISKALKKLEAANIPTAFVGKYPGVFNFLGRLEKSPDLVKLDTIDAWFTAHPNGRVIEYFDDLSEINPQQVEFVQAYKGSIAVIMTSSQWYLNKQLAKQALKDSTAVEAE